MKTVYKEYKLLALKEKNKRGNNLLFFSIIRLVDNFVCMCDFKESRGTLKSMIVELKERVDKELLADDPWHEAECTVLISIPVSSLFAAQNNRDLTNS